MKHTFKYNTYAMLLLLASLTACNSNNVYKSFEGTAQLTWKKSEGFIYTPDIAQEGAYKLIVELRHSSSIRYGQVAINIKHTSPDGTEQTNQHILQLRNAEGELLGEAMGGLCDTKNVISESMQLNSGKHEFEVSHLMEEDNLSGILEVGLIIEKTGAENQ